MDSSLEPKAIPHPDSAKNGLKEGLPKEGQRSREGKSPSFTLPNGEVIDLSGYKFEFNIYRIPEVSGFRMARKV